MLILQMRFIINLMISFSFFSFFFFIFLISIFYFKKFGGTPLYYAADRGDEQVVEILLQKGANVDLPEEVLLLISFPFSFSFSFSFFSFFYQKEGFTPLHVAAQEGHEQIVHILLEKGGANADLANQVLLIILFFSFFKVFFVFEHFFSFFLFRMVKQLLMLQRIRELLI